jgi:SagB-type dehydrogenase family enzyme
VPDTVAQDLGEAFSDLRFMDAIGASMHDETIVIRNPATGASKAFPKEALPILDQFMTWTNTEALVRQALEGTGGEAALNQMIQTVNDLLQLDVLTTRRSELTGARLPPPSVGWTEAMRFLRDTRTTSDTIYAVPADFNAALAVKSAAICRQPSAFYERVETAFRALPQHEANPVGAASFAEVMLKRRTARRFGDQPITETELSTLLYFAWGMTASVSNPLGDVFVRKTSPSGGSLHAIEIYPLVLRVDGVPNGCYHYSVRRHGLEELSREDPSKWIVKACGDQDWVAEAGVVFLCTAFLPRTAWKYDYARVARAVMSEVGYSGQSALLTAAWLGLGAFTTAALRDEMFEEMLGLDPKREPVFSVTGVGRLEPDRDDHSRPRTETPLGVESS